MYRIAGPAILGIAAIVTLVWALAFGGGAAPLVIGDPGPVIRWGLPSRSSSSTCRRRA